MNSNLLHRFFFLCLLVLILGTSSGQAQPSKSQNADAGGSLVFTCVIFDPLPIEPLFYRDGKTQTPIVPRTMRRSLPYKLGPETRFDLLTTETLQDGSTGYKIVGTAPIPQGASRVMFLVEPKPQRGPNDLPLNILAVEDSLERFPPGTFRYANATPIPLRIEFGGVGASAAPGETVLIKPRAVDAGFYPVKIFDASGKEIFQTRFFWEPVVREYVIIKPGASVTEGKLSLRFISEVVEPPKPAETPSVPAR